MKSIASSCALLLIAAAVACSSVRTSYDFDPEMNFGGWKSYAWYPVESRPSGDPRLDSPLLHQRIAAAVDRTLAARGYTLVEDTEPDFYVEYHLSTKQRLDAVTMNRGYGAGPYGRRWGGAGWGGAGWSETYIDEYDEGTLVIDLLDVASRELVWRGWGTRRLAQQPKPEQVTANVDEAVAEILKAFPPQ